MRRLTTGFEAGYSSIDLAGFTNSSLTAYETYHANTRWGTGRAARCYRLRHDLEGENTFFARYFYTKYYHYTGMNSRLRVRDADGHSVLNVKWGYSGDYRKIELWLDGSTEADQVIDFAMPSKAILEMHFAYAESGGTFVLKVNGITRISYTGQTKFDSQGADLGTIDFVGDAGYAIFDDMAVNDTTGTIDNSWCGDGHVIGLTPDGDGAAQGLTPVGGTVNYSLVSDGSNSTYVESDVANTYDLYTVPDVALHSNEIIQRVTVKAVARKLNADSPGIQLGIQRSGMAEEWGAAQNVGIDFEGVHGPEFGVGANWTDVNLQNLKIGVKVAEVLSE